MANNRELSQFANVVGYNGGNIGIGTDNPARSLDVRSGNSTDVVQFSNDSGNKVTFGVSSTQTSIDLLSSKSFRIRSGSDNRFNIATDGKIGINEIDPSSQLHIKGNNNLLRLETTASTGTNYMEFYDASARKGYIGYGSGSNETLYFVNEEVGNFSFYTTPSGGSLTERLRIRSDGDVVIGTNDLESQLGSRRRLAICDTTNGALLHLRGQSPAIFFDQSGGNIGKIYLDSVDLAIYSNTPNSEGTERLRINSTGGLLINTSSNLENSGSAKLHIAHSSGPSITLGRDDSAVTAGNDIGKIAFYGNDGGSYEKVAQITCEADKSHASGDKPGRLLFATTADGASSPTERLRIDSSGRVKIGTISDSTDGQTDAPVYIEMQSDVTDLDDGEGAATTGLVRLHETGDNNNRYHGIELRNKNAGDIRILNKDVNTSDRGDLIIAVPDEDAIEGTHQKITFNSMASAIQISGKGGVTHTNGDETHTDIYIATKTGVTAVDTGAGGAIAGLIRFEDKGTNNNRYHGIELRNRNSGDARILNLDEGATNKSNLVFAIDDGNNILERMRISSAGKVGINESNPSRALEVYDGPSSVNTVIRVGTNAVSSTTDGYAQVEFKHGSASSAWIWHQANSTTGYGGANSLNFYNAHAADYAFYSGGNNERFRILNSGGITFNGDTAAANALDDYETGTWTPTAFLNFNGISSPEGQYEKIGNLVFVVFQFNYSSLTNASSTSAISGLPFTVHNFNSLTGVEATATVFGTGKHVLVYANDNSTRLYFETGKPFYGSTSSGADFFRGSLSYLAG